METRRRGKSALRGSRTPGAYPVGDAPSSPSSEPELHSPKKKGRRQAPLLNPVLLFLNYYRL